MNQPSPIPYVTRDLLRPLPLVRRRWPVLLTALAVVLLLIDLLVGRQLMQELTAILLPQVDEARVHGAFSTLALVALILGAFLRFGTPVLLAVPFLLGPLLPAPLPVLTGDEPHYLMITLSLERDGNLAVRDNYERHEGDFLIGQPLGLPNFQPDSDYSLHPPGTGLLALPGWLLFERRGALGMLAVTGALLVREMLLLGRTVGISRREATLATGAILATPPLALFFRQAYPEIAGALVITYLTRLLGDTLLRRRGVDTPAGRWEPWAAAVAAGVAPWLHLRLVPAVFILVFALGFFDRRMRLILPASMIASLAGMSLAHLNWYGSPWPSAAYSAFSIVNEDPFRGFIGLFLDAHVGLMFVAPIAFLGLIGLPHVWRVAPLWLAIVGVTVIVRLAAQSSVWFWHLGFTTPGRFWTSVLPVSVPLVALAIRSAPRTCAVVSAVTLVWTSFLLAFPYPAYPDSSGLTSLWRILGLTFFPVYSDPPRASTFYGAMALFAALGLIAIWAHITSRRSRPTASENPASP